MMMKIKFSIVLLITGLLSYAQTNDFSYKREIKGVENQWHKLVLPNAIFAKSSPSLSDLRIYGITAKLDTVEAPYTLNLSKEKINFKKINFSIINQSLTANGHYFTFKTDIEEPINQIQLDFVSENFDWRIKLEGSHNQQEWFTILDKYRIVAIKNSITDYTYSKLIFPDSKYSYYRIFVNNRDKSYFKKATILLKKKSSLKYRDYIITKTNVSVDEKEKKTFIHLTLDTKVPVSYVKLSFKDKFDYYRPIHIEYLTDSIKTEKAWKEQYKTLYSGIISSFEENEFTFKSSLLQKLRISIQNHDNQPLSFSSIQTKGFIHELYIRFTKPKASYYLAYGNPNIRVPQYDIKHLTKNIPNDLITLHLETEQVIERNTPKNKNPLFKNKNWIWGILGIIILLLGWFSINMMRNK